MMRCIDILRSASQNNPLRLHMPIPAPYVRQAGSGPGVVCIHSNASSSAQWRGLMEMLAPSFCVLAPDSYGSGKSPDWHSDRVISLEDEVAFPQPVLTAAGSTRWRRAVQRREAITDQLDSSAASRVLWYHSS